MKMKIKRNSVEQLNISCAFSNRKTHSHQKERRVVEEEGRGREGNKKERERYTKEK